MRTRFACLCLLLGLSPGLASAAAESEAAPPQPRVITLVRHGHYAADPSADPRLGPGLTALGIAQARLLGARLAALPVRFDAVYASPLTRAQQTAAVLAPDLRGVSIQTLAGLEECTPPTWRADLVADEPADAMTACAAGLDALFAAQFVPAQGQARNELMVCHGNVIRYLITKALRVDSKAWLEMSVGHTSETVIRIEADGSFKLISAGDVGHLPVNMLTGASGNADLSLDVPAQP